MVKDYMNKKIEIPSNCPSCSFPLQMINMQLFCKNTACDARASKQIEHFCKIMGIKGMGEKTIEKLGIQDITELYSFSCQELVEVLDSQKLADKLYAEIQKTVPANLNLVLAAFGIPLIGNTAANKICSVVSSIDEITPETCKLAGLGEKATHNLVTFLKGDFLEIREYLPFTFNCTSSVSTVSSGKNICITGKLNSFNKKADAYAELIKLGFNVVESVTKTTDFLVDEEGKSSTKRVKAESLEIPIISDLLNFLKENTK